MAYKNAYMLKNLTVILLLGLTVKTDQAFDHTYPPIL